MKKVRAILVNELDEVIQYQGESTHFTRRELTLLPNYDLQRYEIDYDQFHTAHDWKILYQAQSMEGDWSEIFTGTVTYEGTLAENAALTPSQAVYHEDDILRVTVPLLPAGQVQYVGVALPDGTLFLLTGLNGFVALDAANIPVFQGEVAIEVFLVSRRGILKGEYMLSRFEFFFKKLKPRNLLRIPVGVDLLTNPEQWMVGVSSFKVE